MPDNNDTNFLLGQMNAKLDELVRRSDEDRKTVSALAARVAELEKFRWVIVGAAMASGAGMNWLVKVLS